jgi:hypothetical protein
METRKVHSFIVKVWAEPGATEEWRISCNDVQSGEVGYCRGFSCISALVESMVQRSRSGLPNGGENGAGVSH